ncbi:MAG TPA: hypothetical protein VKA30_04105, partial [Actinomycetota bacterium]|nr:hypothetical protein [Actinomycetota bacterium]
MTTILENASARAVIEALDRHERETSATYARMLGGYVEDRPEVLVYVTGMPAPWANGVKAPRLSPAAVDEVIRGVSARLREAGVPGLWEVGPLATPGDLGERLERAGIRRDFTLDMMSAEIDGMDLDVPPPPEIDIRRVAEVGDHERWLRVMEAGFDMPQGH